MWKRESIGFGRERWRGGDHRCLRDAGRTAEAGAWSEVHWSAVARRCRCRHAHVNAVFDGSQRELTKT